MNILGVSCFYHDAAAAIIQNGRLTAAAQEERFTRKKYDSSFPKNAIDYCLREAKVKKSDIDLIISHDNVYKKDVKKNCALEQKPYFPGIIFLMRQALFIPHRLKRPPYLLLMGWGLGYRQVLAAV